MTWITHFLTSSIGRKFIMSLTGLFLIIFLLIHLIGNLQLLVDDGGKQFNLYALFMTTNPLIKTSSYLLYFFILLHAVQGWIIMRANKKARGGQGYDVKVTVSKSTSSFSSTNMGWLGTIIFAFLVLHLYQFWLQMKLGAVPVVVYDGIEVKNLYTTVVEAYSNVLYVIIYVISMIVIGFHLYHGFQSSFQTLGLNHKKYTPLIQGLGKVYAILVPLGLALIPLIMFGKISGLI